MRLSRDGAGLVPPAPAATDAVADAAPAATSFAVRRLADGDALVARVAEIEAAGTATATVFQSAAWLRAVARARTRMQAGEVFGLEVTDAATGALAVLMPLVAVREGGLVVAGFADLGVSDYRAPILGPASPTTEAGRTALWREVRRALAGIDLLRLEAMPAEIHGRSNPFALMAGAARARLTGFTVEVETTVEDLLRSRGKKYRKESERCFRLLEKEGQPSFARAETAADIARAYAVLEAQQSQRHQDAGNEGYVLDRPEYSDFYRDLLTAESGNGFAHILTLSAGPEIVAALLGVVTGGTFTLLRISNGGARWRHLSPGRLVVIEAMRHFVPQGVRAFDMGAGDYPFKRGFGAAERPLHDLVAPLTLKAAPAGAVARAKAFVRARPALEAAIRRFRPRG